MTDARILQRWRDFDDQERRRQRAELAIKSLPPELQDDITEHWDALVAERDALRADRRETEYALAEVAAERDALLKARYRVQEIVSNPYPPWYGRDDKIRAALAGVGDPRCPKCGMPEVCDDQECPQADSQEAE